MRRLVSALLVASTILSSSGAARAAGGEANDVVDNASERAESLAARARDEHARGDSQKAIELYNEAYAAAPAAVLLFNLAVVHEQARNVTEALSFYRRALAAGDLDPALMNRAKERIATLETKPSSSEPAKPELLMQPTPSSSWHPLRITGVAALGAGVVALGVTGILAAMAKSKDSDAGSFCDGDRCTNQRALELTDDARGLATAATVTFVMGAVFLAGGVVLWLVAPSTSSSSSSAAPPKTAAIGLGRVTW